MGWRVPANTTRSVPVPEAGLTLFFGHPLWAHPGLGRVSDASRRSTSCVRGCGSSPWGSRVTTCTLRAPRRITCYARPGSATTALVPASSSRRQLPVCATASNLALPATSSPCPPTTSRGSLPLLDVEGAYRPTSDLSSASSLTTDTAHGSPHNLGADEQTSPAPSPTGGPWDRATGRISPFRGRMVTTRDTHMRLYWCQGSIPYCPTAPTTGAHTRG